ncbi:hypothetical protein EJB05_19761 [Eragrostis curvula]|uniref:Uncharacterized protein n=1 Tax=Eragrostis curvula TaxID=38414 RepID=A0A5J9UY85_9POAL|nr:hypothetical protein EJB05_19761 [Eragrostis curvula]
MASDGGFGLDLAARWQGSPEAEEMCLLPLGYSTNCLLDRGSFYNRISDLVSPPFGDVQCKLATWCFKQEWLAHACFTMDSNITSELDGHVTDYSFSEMSTSKHSFTDKLPIQSTDPF